LAGISGTAVGERLDGTSDHDQIYGLDGDDTLYAGSGNDLLDGGAGKDGMFAGDGNDSLNGGAGDDGMFGQGGNDLLDGGEGNDQVGSAVPHEAGDPGNDVYVGGAGNDRMSAGPGDDSLFGGDGNDRMFGDLAVVRSEVAGADFIAGGAGSDSIAGGGGFDVAYFDLPRRAYFITGGDTTFDFPQSNSVNASRGAERGVVVASDAGEAATADFLIEIEELRFVDGRIVTNPGDAVAQVHRVFEAGLDRAPDPIGLNHWAQQVQAGLPLNAVANGVAQSPEFQARYGALDGPAFVQRLYENVLGRAGEPAGVESWVSALNNGATRGDVLVGFANSPENVANSAATVAAGIWDQDERAAQVARLYDAAFNRLPDLDGFLFNKAALDGGLALNDLALAFGRSPEFASLYGGPGVAPRTLVEALYANTLDRPADADGLAFWTQRIESGAATRAQVLVAFSESLEHQILALPSVEGGVAFA